MTQTNHNSRTALSLVTSLLAMALSILINFFLSPYIVENFGEEANGFTQLANNFVTYATLLTVALNSMAGRFITIAYHNKDYKACARYYTSVLVGNAAIILLLLFPSVYCVFRLDSLIRIETAVVSHVKILFGLVFANFFATQIFSLFAIACYVTNRQYIQNTVNMVRTLCNAAGLVLMFALLVPKIYFVSLVGCVLSLLLIPIFFWIKQKICPELRFDIRYFDIKTVWQMVSSGLWNTLNQCGILLMTAFDLLLANLFIDPVRMGVLSVAKTVPNCIIQLAGTVNSSFSPHLTIAYASKDREQLLSSLRYSMKYSAVLVSIPITVLSVYGVSFYRLWVPSLDAEELAVLSVLTCMQLIPFCGVQVINNLFTTANRLKVNSLSVLIGGAVNILVVFILLRYTSLGLFAIAGVSSCIGIIRNLIVTVPYSARILGLKWYIFYKDVLISCLYCAVCLVICYVFKSLIVPNSWLTMIFSVAVSCLVTLLAQFILFFNAEERATVISRICRISGIRRKN